MAVQGGELNTVQVILRNTVYLRPMQKRILELLNIMSECNMKDLQVFFPFLVEHIFGVNPSYGNGWNLLKTSRNYDVVDFNALVNFLHPDGPFFAIIYKLLTDVYVKYEYPLRFLSYKFKQIIMEGSTLPFYLDKLQIDPNSREPTALTLNAFEYYLFHFAYHLTNSWQLYSDLGYFGGSDTVYLHLSDLYLRHFLPIQTSLVLPIVPAHQSIQLTRSPPPPQTKPKKTPKLFKTSVVKLGSNSLSPTSVTQPHAEIWRSETFLQIIINFWLSVPDQANSSVFNNIKSQRIYPILFGQDPRLPFMNYYCQADLRNTEDVLPKEDHLRVVRIVIKHFHYFVNNIHNDGSPMDELRKRLTGICRRPLYIFLRRHIYHWPLDSSFLLILETYLSFIQPWRYINYNSKASGESNFVDNKWFNFIIENFPAYTILIREIIPRFSRMDLTSPKHAHMLFRLTKVLSQPNLSSILRDIERHLDENSTTGSEIPQSPSSIPGTPTPKTPCSPGSPSSPNSPSTNQAFAFYQLNRANVIIKHEIQELESPNFKYKPLFGKEFHDQIFEFVTSLQQSLCLVKYLLNSTLAQRRARRVSLFQRVKEFFFFGSSGDDYTVDERQKTVTYLEHSITFLSQVFDLPPLQLPQDNRNRADVSNSSANTSSSQPLGAVEPTVINPTDWQKRAKLIRYEANPDLEPIRSTEITFLVRLFHHLSTRINERYKNEIKIFWDRTDFWGSVARQLLAPPCKYYYFDKSVPGNFAPRICDELPARVCLRSLAGHQTLLYIFLSGVLVFFYGYPVIPFYFFIFFLFVCLIFAKALFDLYLPRRSSNSSPVIEQERPFIPLDVSFTD